MVVDLARLDRAADLFADIPFNGAGWSAPLTEMSEAVGALGTLVIPIKGRVPGPFPCSDSIAEAVHQYAHDGWSDADFRQRGVHRLGSHGFLTDLDIATPETMRREPFYQDLCRKSGIWWFAGIRLDVMGEIQCASMHKPVGSDPFSPDELAALLAVAPRISMSLSILAQLDRIRTAGLTDAIEAMGTAAFLVDRTGRVLRGNAAVERVIGRGIDVAGGVLTASGPDAAPFRRYLGAVLRAGPLASPASGRPIALRRAVGRPLAVRAMRLRSEAALGYFASAWALVTVSDPNLAARPPLRAAQALLELTPKEALTLDLLMAHAGNGRAAAAAAAVGYETLRSHVKNIHIKAGTRSVTELLVLVARLSAHD